MPSQTEITALLDGWRRGDRRASERAAEWIYPHLHRLAGARLGGDDSPASLATTDLVHEAYLRLGEQRARWVSREQFFAIASRVVRRVVADHVRRRNRLKRGGGRARVTLDGVHLAEVARGADVLAVDSALERLEEIDPVAVRVVEMRFFAGMGWVEIAQALEVSESTVGRRWRFARAWLRRQLGSRDDA